jgi:hypothetical protein
METPIETNEEQQLDNLDAMLVAEEPGQPVTPATPEATPAPAEPAPAAPAPAPEAPPVEPVTETPAPEAGAVSEPPSEPVEVKPPKGDSVPLAVHLHKTAKLRKRFEKAEERAAASERRANELAAQLAKEVDPLEVWQADPENENLPTPKEVFKGHDAFQAAKFQREAAAAAGRPTLDQATVARADALLDAAPPAQRTVVNYAVSQKWMTPEDAREIALAPDPAAKAMEIAIDHFDTFGNETEVRFKDLLIPPASVPAPTPRPVTRPAAAPRANAPAPPPAPRPQPAKAKEPTNETEESLPEGPLKDVVDFLFHRDRE